MDSVSYADDVLEPGTLGKRLAAAEAVNADVAVCDWIDMYDDGVGGIVLGPRRSIDWSALEANPELSSAVHSGYPIQSSDCGEDRRLPR